MIVSLELPVSSIDIRTTVVRHVRRSRKEVEGVLAHLNLLAIGSGYQFESEQQQIVAVARHAVHVETLAVRAEELAAFAILQLCVAEDHADTLAELCDGQIAEWQHPESGHRIIVDDMLDVVRDVFLPAGQAPSRFESAEEMARVVELMRGTPFASLSGSPTGVCVEVPFGEHNTSLIEIVSDALHPVLGSGLAVATMLPYDRSEEDLIAIAAELQRAQGETVEAGGQLGAWAVRKHHGRLFVAYCRFVPNAIFRPGMVPDAAIGEVSRALWADRRAFPDLPERNAWEIVAARNGLMGA